LIDVPDLATFSAMLADRRFYLAAGVAALAGVVRGFSGFGSALIHVPLISAIYDPRLATVSYILMDLPCTMPFALRAIPRCHWREVLPAIIAGAIAVPLGTYVQKASDPILLRWAMAVLVMCFLALVITGWRYRGRPGALPASVAGFFSGFAGGAAQMSGPPLILYWLGTPGRVAVVRANLLVFFLVLGITLVVSYVAQGLVTPRAIAIAMLLWPLYLIALFVGARWFRGATDTGYRRVAYIIVALAALVSLPLFDGLLR
jgi:uncharacterized membrane protein YfcA